MREANTSLLSSPSVAAPPAQVIARAYARTDELGGIQPRTLAACRMSALSLQRRAVQVIKLPEIQIKGLTTALKEWVMQSLVADTPLATILPIRLRMTPKSFTTRSSALLHPDVKSCTLIKVIPLS